MRRSYAVWSVTDSRCLGSGHPEPTAGRAKGGHRRYRHFVAAPRRPPPSLRAASSGIEGDRCRSARCRTMCAEPVPGAPATAGRVPPPRSPGERRPASLQFVLSRAIGLQHTPRPRSHSPLEGSADRRPPRICFWLRTGGRVNELGVTVAGSSIGSCTAARGTSPHAPHYGCGLPER